MDVYHLTNLFEKNNRATTAEANGAEGEIVELGAAGTRMLKIDHESFITLQCATDTFLCGQLELAAAEARQLRVAAVLEEERIRVREMPDDWQQQQERRGVSWRMGRERGRGRERKRRGGWKVRGGGEDEQLTTPLHPHLPQPRGRQERAGQQVQQHQDYVELLGMPEQLYAPLRTTPGFYSRLSETMSLLGLSLPPTLRMDAIALSFANAENAASGVRGGDDYGLSRTLIFDEEGEDNASRIAASLPPRVVSKL